MAWVRHKRMPMKDVKIGQFVRFHCLKIGVTHTYTIGQTLTCTIGESLTYDIDETLTPFEVTTAGYGHYTRKG